ncbi:uncharacterized protein Hap1MRO34_019694 [Clarias gariepinus]
MKPRPGRRVSATTPRPRIPLQRAPAGGQRTPAAVKLASGGAEGKPPPTAIFVPPTAGFNFRSGRVGNRAGVYVDCGLDNVSLRALVDTGSTVSLLRGGLLKRGERGRVLPDPAVNIRTVSGSYLRIRACRTVRIQMRCLHGKEGPYPALASTLARLSGGGAHGTYGRGHSGAVSHL